jgi:hypothetical protein
MCEKSEDLEDEMQALVDFLTAQTGATGVYIGKLRHPEKEIEEDGDPNAHLDDEAAKVIKYSHASKNHEFMIDVVLTPEEGVLTHSVFAEGGEDGDDDDAASALNSDGGPSSQKGKKEQDILKTFKHTYVKEVVRESRIHFQKVPRLGSFMAIPLIYESCLFDEAL